MRILIISATTQKSHTNITRSVPPPAPLKVVFPAGQRSHSQGKVSLNFHNVAIVDLQNYRGKNFARMIKLLLWEFRESVIPRVTFPAFSNLPKVVPSQFWLLKSFQGAAWASFGSHAKRSVPLAKIVSLDS